MGWRPRLFTKVWAAQRARRRVVLAMWRRVSTRRMTCPSCHTPRTNRLQSLLHSQRRRGGTGRLCRAILVYKQSDRIHEKSPRQKRAGSISDENGNSKTLAGEHWLNIGASLIELVMWLLERPRNHGHGSGIPLRPRDRLPSAAAILGINRLGLINKQAYKMVELPEWVQKLWVGIANT